MLPDIDFLGFFWAAISNLIAPFVNFCIGFLPDGDPAVYTIIDGVGNIGGVSTFNVFYFCDWRAVLICFGVLVTVALIVQIYKFVMRGVDMAAKTVEAIPVVE